MSIWFVYRSPGEGPLAKRVRRLSAPSILAWFQARIEEARVALHPGRISDDELGGPVRGFAAIFEAAKKHSLHTPKSTAALAKLLESPVLYHFRRPSREALVQPLYDRMLRSGRVRVCFGRRLLRVHGDAAIS